ncbi:hypothetical protein P0136_03985 [Lentisphaerota bacterium ZTH]|nr:hypothetical protein JYG24_04900 [Lentisphaerota bacterium]WET07157.1 hypothetical protein P0136_03985 [Lentisphaerota bacterium ZTH]
MRNLIVVLLLAVFPLLATAEDKPGAVAIEAGDTAGMEYKIIPLMSLEFDLIRRVCSKWLHKDGRLVYEKYNNSVLVYDKPEIIERIRRFIKNNDTPPVNIRVDLSSKSVGPYHGSSFGYRRQMSPTVVNCKNGQRIVLRSSQQPGYRVYAEQRRRNISSLNTSFIVTRSGSPATLWSGRTVVDPTWLYYNKKYPERVYYGTAEGNYISLNGIFNKTRWNKVGTALYVKPRYLGNGLIEVEVYPEISVVTGKGRRKTVKVYNLSTKVILRNGETVPVGGMISNRRNRYLNIFGPEFFKAGGAGEIVNTTIKATIIKPGAGTRRSWIPR